MRPGLLAVQLMRQSSSVAFAGSAAALRASSLIGDEVRSAQPSAPERLRRRMAATVASSSANGNHQWKLERQSELQFVDRMRCAGDRK
jgi:hypothetical protein